MGFIEIPHTADWSIRVWSDDLAGLLVEAARGLNTLSGAKLAHSPRVIREFEVHGPDAEGLLVAFLSELVYYAEQENIGFDQFDIRLKDDRLRVNMGGAPLESLSKAVKAVTYHNLKIEQTSRGLEAVIVFDV
jgi:SHS2 domain-containing protein